MSNNTEQKIQKYIIPKIKKLAVGDLIVHFYQLTTMTKLIRQLNDSAKAAQETSTEFLNNMYSIKPAEVKYLNPDVYKLLTIGPNELPFHELEGLQDAVKKFNEEVIERTRKVYHEKMQHFHDIEKRHESTEKLATERFDEYIVEHLSTSARITLVTWYSDKRLILFELLKAIATSAKVETTYNMDYFSFILHGTMYKIEAYDMLNNKVADDIIENLITYVKNR